MTRLKDIADFCGVSVSTVSKALSDSGEVSPCIKQKILDTAGRLHYAPKRQRRKTDGMRAIGILKEPEDVFTEESILRWTLLESFRKAVTEKGGILVWMPCSPKNRTGISPLSFARMARLSGMLILDPDPEGRQVREIVEAGIPAVLINHFHDSIPTVYADRAKGIEEFLRILRSYGHRRFAYLYTDTGERCTEHIRILRWCNRTKRAKVPERFLCFLDPDAPQEHVSRIRSILSRRNAPDCLLLSDSRLTAQAWAAILEEGKQVSHDIALAIIGGDGNSFVTGWNADAEQMGRMAARELFSCMEDGDAAPFRLIAVPGVFCPGTTAGRKDNAANRI